MFCFEHQNHVMLFKVLFKQWLSGEEHEYTTNPFLFFLKKAKPIKQKKIFNISYLIMVSQLICLLLSRYRLACKYRIVSQISIYNWMQNLHFLIFLILHLHIFKIKLQLIDYLNLFQQTRWFVAWLVESRFINPDSNLSQNIIKAIIKEEQKRWNSDAFQS